MKLKNQVKILKQYGFIFRGIDRWHSKVLFQHPNLLSALYLNKSDTKKKLIKRIRTAKRQGVIKIKRQRLSKIENAARARRASFRCIDGGSPFVLSKRSRANLKAVS